MEHPLQRYIQQLEADVEELREYKASYERLAAGLVSVETMLKEMPWFTKTGTQTAVWRVLVKVRELQDG